MGTSDILRLLVCAVAAAVLVSYHRQIAAAIEAFKDNFPGNGPRTPMHPSPAGDDAFLRSKSPERPDTSIT